jgi:hypothetical protein
MPKYTCPGCQKTLSVDPAPDPGEAVECPVCQTAFAPVSARPVAAARPAAARAAKPAAAQPTIPLAPPPPPPPPAHKPDDDDDSTPYTMYQESEEEKRLNEASKPKFGEVKDKFKKSARGPASKLVVLPSNLLVAEGAMTALVGLGFIIVGLWPIVFADAPPSEEELSEQLFIIFCGGFACIWGGLICVGAAAMQNLGSYSWGMAGAVIGCLPLLAGVFAIVTLRDPRVIAGFEEPLTGPIGSSAEDEKKKDEDEEDDDEDEEEEEERPKRKKKRK